MVRLTFDSQGDVLRRFAPFTLIAVLLVSCSLAAAQQVDFTAGFSTLRSSKSNSASQTYIGPAETGGNYAGASIDFLNARNMGFNGEFAFLYNKGLYNGFQQYRPVFYDVNAMFAPPLTKKFTADFLAGVGGETLIFYNTFGGCNYSTCTVYTNSTHFAVHLGAGVRYYFFRKFFVRPEAHLYIIPNNNQFASDYVARVGGSIGYTFGRK